MTERVLRVSFGGRHHADVEKTRELTWPQFAQWLTQEPPESDSKESRGWYCGANFTPATDEQRAKQPHISGAGYRHSDNFIARDLLTLDFDHVDEYAFDAVAAMFRNVAHAIYTTHSHLAPGKGHRFRLVVPLSRSVGYDEFQAIARKVGERIGIEMVAAESFVPCQFMFQPLRRPGGEFKASSNTTAPLLDADAVLAKYTNWSDRNEWPRRKDGDNPTDPEHLVSPRDKPGIIGEFCRAVSISEAIRRFELPYVPTSTEGRWTYTAGSRPEGAIVYDDDSKLHSHHDTDPARGQSNAFDLVRAHRFHDLDGPDDKLRPVTERPSFKAMCQLALEQPEVRAGRVAADLVDAGPAPDDFKPIDGVRLESNTADSQPRQDAQVPRLAVTLAEKLANPTQPRWLLKDELERAVIALMVGPRGSFKSFNALHWTMRVAVQGQPVYVVSGEGGDFDRRARAWLKHYAPDLEPEDIPLYVVERRLDLNSDEGIIAIREDCIRLNIRPVLFLLDTFSKLSGGLDENENTAVKQFIGRLDKGLKRAETAFDATVLLVCHTGHSDAGRARGASALGADTDAEYIVQRPDGSMNVTVTRERFKASPELPPLSYRAEVVNLDYADEDGQPVTSLVLVATDPPKARKGGKLQGANQALLHKILLEHGADKEPVSPELILTDACSKLANDYESAGRDTRRSTFRKALHNMQMNEVVFQHPDNKVALFSPEIQVVTETPEGWL